MANMCKVAGLQKKSIHSLRATGATALFNAGVPEKLIRMLPGIIQSYMNAPPTSESVAICI